jgi:hypothetical protein
MGFCFQSQRGDIVKGVRNAALAGVFLCAGVMNATPAQALNGIHARLADPAPRAEKVVGTPLYQTIDHRLDYRDRASNTPPSSAMDSCLPLLKSIHTSPPSVADRTWRSASNTTADLGLVFGVRVALSEPKRSSSASTSKAGFGLWHPFRSAIGSSHAQARADYRNCQTQKAFEALSAFRWQR